jgi:hypothetical protein
LNPIPDGRPGAPKDAPLMALDADMFAYDTECFLGLIAGLLAAVIGLAIISDLISHNPTQDCCDLESSMAFCVR